MQSHSWYGHHLPQSQDNLHFVDIFPISTIPRPEETIIIHRWRYITVPNLVQTLQRMSCCPSLFMVYRE